MGVSLLSGARFLVLNDAVAILFGCFDSTVQRKTLSLLAYYSFVSLVFSSFEASSPF